MRTFRKLAAGLLVLLPFAVLANEVDEQPMGEAVERHLSGDQPFGVWAQDTGLLETEAGDRLETREVLAEDVKTIKLTGVVPPGTEVSLDMDLIMNGRAVRGILGGDAIADLFIPKLVELYLQGRFPYDKMITFYPFEEINRAVEDMEKGLVVKPVLRL